MKYALEWNFQILDDASRRCGRILKITRVFDCPGFSPRRVTAPVELLDVYPTLLELARLRPARAQMLEG